MQNLYLIRAECHPSWTMVYYKSDTSVGDKLYWKKSYECLVIVLISKKEKKHKNIVYLSSTLSTRKNKMADFISNVHLITTRQHLENPSFYLFRLESLPIYESLTSFQLSVITDSRKQIKTKTIHSESIEIQKDNHSHLTVQLSWLNIFKQNMKKKNMKRHKQMHFPHGNAQLFHTPKAKGEHNKKPRGKPYLKTTKLTRKQK